MRLLPKLVLAVLAPVAAGALGAALLLSWRVRHEDAGAHAEAELLLQVRAQDIAGQLRARREALRLLAAAPLLRQQDGVAIDAALQAWSGPAGQFEGLRFQPLPMPGAAPAADPGAAPAALDEATLAALRSGRDDVLLSALAGQRLQQRVGVRATDGTLAGMLEGRFTLDGLLAGGTPLPPLPGVLWLLLDGHGRLLADPAGLAPASARASGAPAVNLPGPAAAPLLPAGLAAAVASAPVSPAAVAGVDGRPLRAQDIVVGGATYKLMQAPVAGTDWRLVFAQPSAAFDARRTGPMLRVGSMLGAILLLALGLAWLVRRQIVRPLQQLADAHARVQAGDLGVRAPERGDGEIADLERSFNRMAEALAAAEHRFRRVFEAFPHPVLLSRLADGAFIDVNPAFEITVGRPRAQLLGLGVAAPGFLPDAEFAAQLGRRLKQQGGLDGETAELTLADGRRIWLLYSSRLLELEGERVALTVCTDITPLKQAEERLRRSEQSFTALFQSAPLPLSYTRRSESHGGSYWNQAWYRAFGYDPALVEGQAGPDFGLWVDLADRERLADAVRRQGRITGFEVQLRPRGGEPRWFQLAAEVIASADDAILMLAYVDVTQERAAAAAARAAQDRLQAVFDASPVAMIVSDALDNFRAVAANAAWYRQFQREPAQVIGRSGDEMVLWTDLPARARLLDRLLLPGDAVSGIETTLLRGDGSRLQVRLAAQRYRAGDDELVVMVQEDITEQVRAAQALGESRELLAHTFDLMPEPLGILDSTTGRYIDVNRRWEQVIGLAKAQVVGRTALEMGLWRDAEDRQRLMQRLATEGRLLDVPVTLNLPGGGTILCEVSASTMVEQGRSIGIWTLRDVTERTRAQAALRELNETLEERVAARTQELSDAIEGLRRAQAELVRAEKLASLGALVAGVAHELNTPIGNAVMVASTLADHQRAFEAAMAGGLRRSALEGFLGTTREAAQVLERNLQRAAELIGSFKQLAADQSSSQRRSFALAEVVQEVLLALSPTLRRSAVAITTEVPATLRLDSFPGPLGQVLVNLITNALVHAFEPAAAGRIRVEAAAGADGWLALRLADDGRGIPEADLGRIFDPFFTTRLGQGGSGLGLHIVYTLVTGVLGGRIAVHSQPGEGTEFVIDLPMSAPQG